MIDRPVLDGDPPSDPSPGLPVDEVSNNPTAWQPEAGALADDAGQPQTPSEGRPHVGHRPSRIGRAWIGLGVGIGALIIVLVFILENLHSVNVSFFGASGSVPLGVALLLAAVLGALVTLLVGSIRIMQLRRQVADPGRSKHHLGGGRP